MAEEWISELDSDPSVDRANELERILSEYELITIPTYENKDRDSRNRGQIYLLRRRALELSPQLEIVREGDELVVLLRHPGHEQLADLWVWTTERDGGHISSARVGVDWSATWVGPGEALQRVMG